MFPHVPPYRIRIGICITVPAQVPAGVVLADVSSDIAGAFLPVVGVRRQNNVLADGGFKGLLCHAAETVRAGAGEPSVFGAGLYGHAVTRRDLHKGSRQCQLDLKRHSPRFGEVAPDLLVKIDEADHAGMRTAFQGFTYSGERFEMPFLRPCGVYENRVVSPAHAVRADDTGKRFERVHDLSFFRDVWLDVFPIGRDRSKPVLAVFFQQIQIPMPEQGGRVLCAEYDKVHDGRIQPVPGYGGWIKGVPHEHRAFPQAVCEPLRVESRYVRTVPGLDDHG